MTLYKTTRSAVWLILANITPMISGAVLGLIIPKMLGVSLYGLNAVMGTLTKYVNYGQVGVASGLGQEMPRYLGEKRGKEAKLLADVAFSATQILLLPGVLVIVALGIFRINPVSQLNWTLIALMLASLLIGLYNSLANRCLFSYGAFSSFAKLQLAEAGLSAAIVIPLVYWAKLEGLWLCTVIVHIFVLICFRLVLKIKFSYRWDWTSIKRLLGTGFPMYLTGTAMSLFTTVDTLLIAILLSPHWVGIFAFPLALLTTAGNVPTSLNKFFQREIAYDRGDKGALLPVSEKFLGLPFALYSFLAIFAALLAASVARPFLTLYYYEFQGAIPLLFLGLIGFPFMHYRVHLHALLFAERKPVYALRVHFVATGLKALSTFLLLKLLPAPLNLMLIVLVGSVLDTIVFVGLLVAVQKTAGYRASAMLLRLTPLTLIYWLILYGIYIIPMPERLWVTVLLYAGVALSSWAVTFALYAILYRKYGFAHHVLGQTRAAVSEFLTRIKQSPRLAQGAGGRQKL